MRSGWNHSSWSSFSPTEASLIGRPVTARTESAAPPRASPSSFVRTIAVERDPLLERLGDVHGLLAGHRVEDEQDVRRPRRRGDARELVHQRRRRPGAGRPCRRSPRRRPARSPRRCPASPPRPDRCAPRRRRGSGSACRAARAGRSRPGAGGRRRRAPASCPSLRSISASFAAAVVLPEPWRPASRITVGRAAAKASRESPPPIIAVSSSWTIFTTCWPGVRLFVTSSPTARSFTRATKSFTTWRLTSASSSARRISRIAFETASSSSRPAAAEVAEGVLELVGKRVEHGRERVRAGSQNWPGLRTGSFGTSVRVSRSALGEVARVERPEVVEPLPDADELHRQAELVGDRDRDPALRRAVQLRQHDAR